MIVHDLSHDTVKKMPRIDLATIDGPPSSPIGEFDFNGCTCGVANFIGQPPWERHDQGDELLHVLDGECRLTVREGDSESTRTIRLGELALVPRGCWHRNYAPTGVTMMFITPRDGNQHSWEDPCDQ
jgi:mannose-6-phosphate isomerase-like protein (cupin superfamily)